MKQKTLLNKEITLKEAKELLEKNGFYVTKIGRYGKSISSLISFYYTSLNEVYRKLGYEELFISNDKIDQKALQEYLNRNEAANINRKQALINLKTILDLFFKYYEDLHLDKPITNLRFLLTDGSWILNKIRILHKEKIKDYEDSGEMDRWFDGLCEEEDDKIIKLREQRHLQILGQKK